MSKNQKKNFLAVGIVVGCIALVLVLKFVFGPSGALKPSDSPRSKGNPGSPFKIVEYMDFQCPACSKGAAALKDFFKNNPDKVYLEVKYYPLESMHAHALRSARYAECAAAQGKFWLMHDQLMEKQAEWRDLLNADPIFMEMAKTAGIDMAKLEVCMADNKVSDTIAKEKEEGKKLGIESTPTYFINEKMIVGPNALSSELMSILGRVKVDAK